MKNTFNKFVHHTPHVLRASFSQIAQAVMRVKTPFLPFRVAANVHQLAGMHNPMAEARVAFMRQHYMSPCYLPSMS